jgi:hypothetical protein
VPPTWITAFLDFSPDTFEAGVRFWSEVTTYAVSPGRGAAGEFATLEPGDGDAFLRLQRLETGADRIHLDLHVADPRAAADEAIALGATEVASDGYVVLRSPGGFTFCTVAESSATLRRPRPSTWPDGHSSLLDQVCIDIPSASYEVECAFWRDLTGWELRGSEESEFRSLRRPPDQPIRLLLQRLDEETGEVRAHLDWAATERQAETDRHVSVGATIVDVRDGWTVLAAPAGRRYCVTDRDPETGMLG